MKENEIIERLEVLVKNGFPFCADALNLIKHLKELDKKNENIIRLADKTIESQSAEIEKLNAEIERLNIRNKTLTAITKNYDWKFAKAKSEAIKEFADEIIKTLKDALYGLDIKEKIISKEEVRKRFESLIHKDIPEVIEHVKNKMAGDE